MEKMLEGMQALNQPGSELAPDCALCTTDANSRGILALKYRGLLYSKWSF